jgi:hypothetical protein
MLYQLSYALRPHYQVSTFGLMDRETDIAFNRRQRKLLPGSHRCARRNRRLSVPAP